MYDYYTNLRYNYLISLGKTKEEILEIYKNEYDNSIEFIGYYKYDGVEDDVFYSFINKITSLRKAITYIKNNK